MTKRITALAILLALVLTLGGCHNTNYVAKAGDIEITPGVYLMIQLNAYNALAEKMNVEDTFSDLSIAKQMKQLSPLDDRTAESWMYDLTMQDMTTYIAIEKLFTDLKFTLTDEDLASIKTDSEKLYASYQTYYEDNGIGIDSYKLWLTNQYKGKMVFKSIYYEDGTSPVSIADQKAAFLENYASIKSIQIPYYNYDETEGYTSKPAEEITDLKNSAAEMVRRMNEEGTDIDVINAEWDVEQGYSEEGEAIDALTMDTFDMDTSYYTGTMITQLKALEIGKAAYTDDTNYLTFIVYKKYNPLETDTQFEANKYSVVYKLKQTEYIQYLKDYLKDTTIETKESQMNSYSPFNIAKYVASSTAS